MATSATCFGFADLKEAFSNCRANAKYTSKTVQNELISMLSSMVKDSVARRVAQAKMWTITADETTDRSSREQLVLVARYVDEIDKQFVVREDPACMIVVFEQIEKRTMSVEFSESETEVKLSGANIGHLILTEIGKTTLDMAACIGQGYDKASTMAGEAVGAAAIVKDVPDLADYYLVFAMPHICPVQSAQLFQ